MGTNRREPSTNSIELAPKHKLSISMLFALAVGIPLVADFSVLIATGTLDRFFWLFQQAAPFFIVAWPITLPVWIWLIYAHQSTSRRGQLKSHRLLLLAPLIVIPFTMLVWGAVFEHLRGEGYVRWQLSAVHRAFDVSIAIGLLAVVFNRGRRSFVAASTLLLLLFSFTCGFTAGSSVTGDWL